MHAGMSDGENRTYIVFRESRARGGVGRAGTDIGSEGSASKYSRSISWLVTDLAHIILPKTKWAKSNEEVEQQ